MLQSLLFRDCTVSQSSPESPGGRDFAGFLLLLELHRACQVVHPSAVRVDEGMNEWRISTGQGPDISEAECPFPRIALTCIFIYSTTERTWRTHGFEAFLWWSCCHPVPYMETSFSGDQKPDRFCGAIFHYPLLCELALHGRCGGGGARRRRDQFSLLSSNETVECSWGVPPPPLSMRYLVSWKNSFLPQAASRPALVLAPLTLWRSLGFKKVLLHRNQKLKRFIYFNPFFIHTNLSLCFPSCFVIPFNLVFLSFSFYFYCYPSWSNFFHMINLCKKCFGFTSAVNRILWKT